MNSIIPARVCKALLLAGAVLCLCGLLQAAALPEKSTLPAGKEAAAVPAFPEGEGEEANFRRALLLVQTMEMLRKNYVDGSKVTYKELFDHAMQGMLSALDPYSAYEAPREFRQQQFRRTGAVAGIGATAVKPDGRPLTLIRILPGSAAEEQNLRPGDQITAIDGENVVKFNLAGALEKLRGNPGSRVTLKIRRGNSEFTRTLTRKIVQNSSVVPGSVKLIAGDVGYIKLREFTASSAKEMEEALLKLRSLKARSLILDLRYNPGGVVNSALRIASMFLGEGKVVFRARTREKKEEQNVKSIKEKNCETALPLVVLVNAFSASSSEILTGALQDHKRAAVMGVRTFGKGTILTVVPVSGGGAVRYASAFYVTPGGRVIEKMGIIPDVEVRISSREVMTLSGQTMRYPGEIQPPHRGTIRDRQLARAVEYLQKKSQNSAAEK